MFITFTPMKKIINAYHLKAGLLLSLALPAIFVFQETVPERMIIRFISSSLFIFTLWGSNFMLVDFKRKYKTRVDPVFYGRMIIAFVITYTAYICIGLLVDNTGTMLENVRGENADSIKSWFYLTLRLFLLNVFVLIIKYLFDTYEEKRRIEIEYETLKTQNLAALHEVLKQQLKPHFLFNSLDTLKSLVKRNPELAELFITELAAVYRYMMSHQNKTVVTLKEEIIFLESYLSLLRIRFGESIKTKISVSNELYSSLIPPNTLQLLIENAVKHNGFSMKNPLSITVFAENNFLTVSNNLQPKEGSNESSSLGLSNISSRYRLLFKKDIIIQQKNNYFLIQLPIANDYFNN